MTENPPKADRAALMEGDAASIDLPLILRVNQTFPDDWDVLRQTIRFFVRESRKKDSCLTAESASVLIHAARTLWDKDETYFYLMWSNLPSFTGGGAFSAGLVASGLLPLMARLVAGDVPQISMKDHLVVTALEVLEKMRRATNKRDAIKERRELWRDAGLLEPLLTVHDRMQAVWAVNMGPAVTALKLLADILQEGGINRTTLDPLFTVIRQHNTREHLMTVAFYHLSSEITNSGDLQELKTGLTECAPVLRRFPGNMVLQANGLRACAHMLAFPGCEIFAVDKGFLPIFARALAFDNDESRAAQQNRDHGGGYQYEDPVQYEARARSEATSMALHMLQGVIKTNLIACHAARAAGVVEPLVALAFDSWSERLAGQVLARLLDDRREEAIPGGERGMYL